MMPSDTSHWPLWQRLLFRFGLLFLGMALVTFPLHRPYLPDPGSLLAPLTTATADWMAAHVWHLQPGYLREIANDNTLLYVHLGNVFLLALLGTAAWSATDRKRMAHPRLHYGLRTTARYFLAAAMLSYGFVKVFKVQFYLPEPNTLFTPMGEVPRDLLFWSTMGTSRAYSIFTGSLEILVGLLLFWRRTTLLGALLGLAVMGHVLALNLCFDISLKVFSSLLCLLCLVLLAPQLRQVWAFFLQQQVLPRPPWTPDWAHGRRRIAYLLAKTFVISALIFDAVGFYVETGTFNDDLAPRPPLHGAYDVMDFVWKNQILNPNIVEARPWRRVFVHRQGFFIVQGMDDRMHDYALDLDQASRKLLFLDPATSEYGDFLYRLRSNGEVQLQGIYNQDSVSMILQPLDWRAMPLLRGDFHWTSDRL